jgi:hypothetical protein
MIKGKQRVTRSGNRHSLAISIKTEETHTIEDKSIDGECPKCHGVLKLWSWIWQQVPTQTLVKVALRSNVPSFLRGITNSTRFSQIGFWLMWGRVVAGNEYVCCQVVLALSLDEVLLSSVESPNPVHSWPQSRSEIATSQNNQAGSSHTLWLIEPWTCLLSNISTFLKQIPRITTHQRNIRRLLILPRPPFNPSFNCSLLHTSHHYCWRNPFCPSGFSSADSHCIPDPTPWQGMTSCSWLDGAPKVVRKVVVNRRRSLIVSCSSYIFALPFNLFP